MVMTRTTIAVVDDDEGVRSALRELLRSMGYDAFTFGSAEEFLATPRRGEIDCLIADVHLPGMSGVALVGALAKSGIRLPALYITAHDDATTLASIRQSGSIPHLRKPFSDEQLADAVLYARRDLERTREVLNTLFYLNRSGCQWDMLPHDLLPKSTVYDYFAQWRDDGTWTRIVQALREQVRVAAGRAPTPSAGAWARGGPTK
jgi:CheY-like chemotaxis protein